MEQTNVFRVTRKSELKVYRCKECKSIYNLYTGTVFEQRQLRPQQAVLLIRGVLKGEPSDVLARELELNYVTVLQLRRKIQDNAKLLQSEEPLPDFEAESDELFQNAGKKVTNISILWIRRVAEPTSGADAAPTRMIVHPF